VFKDEEFDQFISFLQEGNSNFKTKSESKFEAAFELSEKEDLSEGIQSSYKALSKQLEQKKFAELNKNRENIKEMLSNEIINRYYFEKGEYQNHIEFSPFIKEAISVLENEDQYSRILANGKN
jgi:carboxyl-terminal processing protease